MSLSAEEKMNRLWDAYADGSLEERNFDAFVLCEYESGVNGEGHSGFFFNNEDSLEQYHDVLKEILPASFYEVFLKAYRAYDTDTEDEVCEEADDYFYENEEQLLDILQSFADDLE